MCGIFIQAVATATAAENVAAVLTSGNCKLCIADLCTLSALADSEYARICHDLSKDTHTYCENIYNTSTVTLAGM